VKNARLCPCRAQAQIVPSRRQLTSCDTRWLRSAFPPIEGRREAASRLRNALARWCIVAGDGRRHTAKTNEQRTIARIGGGAAGNSGQRVPHPVILRKVENADARFRASVLGSLERLFSGIAQMKS
jgi:hypothetical protein